MIRSPVPHLAACAFALSSALPALAATPAGDPWTWTEDEVRAAVDQVRAGRDLTPESWPGGARVAVLLSFDVDNETVHGLRDGEVSIGPLSQGEYGARRALPRVLDLLDAWDVPASFFFPAWSLKLAPQQAEWILGAEEGHEIAVHGWIHERNSALDGPTERRPAGAGRRHPHGAHGAATPGYRAPSWNFSPNTLAIVRDLGFAYESSLMADDRPYELVADGEPTGLVELPVSWVLDDAPLLNPLGSALCQSPGRDAGVDRRVRSRLGGAHHVPADDASPPHRPPLAHRGPGGAARSHRDEGGRLVRHPRAGGRVGAVAGGDGLTGGEARRRRSAPGAAGLHAVVIITL
jgi:peptidoglycan/xylan/chitin deacetylase (PgdA/CDA1 family)